jgi:hypothetical protein
MNEFSVKRGQGGIVKSLSGEDHISGFIMYVPDTDLPSGFSATERIKAVSTIETAENLGISADSTKVNIKALYYHLSEIFRINPAIVLYVGLFKPTTDYKEVKEMQNFAERRLRQIAVYNPSGTLAATDITKLQGVADTLEVEQAPLSILYAANITSATTLTNMAVTKQKNVSVVIAESGDSDAVALRASLGKSLTAIGTILGILSLSAVHESIAWVQKFPTGISKPALADGSLINELDRAVITDLDTKRFLFFVTYPGFAGSYLNDSHTMDLATSDYAQIESVRTMDKAVRGIYTYLLPYLSSPLYVNPENGQLSADTVTFLEQLAGKQLEDMERAGELSGYKVTIDPAQNVLSTSTVEFVIKQVPVGVMRKINIKIGYTTKLE